MFVWYGLSKGRVRCFAKCFQKSFELMQVMSGHNGPLRVSSSTDTMKSIYGSSLASIASDKLVKEALEFDEKGGRLTVGGEKTYKVSKNVVVVGFGKAVRGMLQGLASVLGQHIVRGVVSVSHTHPRTTAAAMGHHLDEDHQQHTVRICEGARNNLPDQASLEATRAIVKEVSSCGEDEVLIVLISGGGSALLCQPAEGISLTEKIELTNVVAGAGASIQELNQCRMLASAVKGGQLARMAQPAQVISLILSDIIDSPLHLVASGPTVPCHHEELQQQVISIIDKYRLRERLSRKVLTLLETPRPVLPSKAVSTDVQNVNLVIGDNTIATAAAVKQAMCCGFSCFTLTHSLQGEAHLAGVMFAGLAVHLLQRLHRSGGSVRTQVDLSHHVAAAVNYNSGVESYISSTSLPACLVSGGETTVVLKGSGRGGRNQELVLGFALELRRLLCLLPHLQSVAERVRFCSLGTDGQDGPTPAAGACVSGKDVLEWKEQTILAALDNNDSYHFFLSQCKEGLINTGLTGTNVMDVQILLVL